jgi:hypothetical protein
VSPVRTSSKALSACILLPGIPRSWCPLTALDPLPGGRLALIRRCGSRAWTSAWTQRWNSGAHPGRCRPGKILTDLTVALALDGDCLADVAMLLAAGTVRAGGLDPVVSAGGPFGRRCSGGADHPLSAGRRPGAGLGPGR